MFWFLEENEFLLNLVWNFLLSLEIFFDLILLKLLGLKVLLFLVFLRVLIFLLFKLFLKILDSLLFIFFNWFFGLLVLLSKLCKNDDFLVFGLLNEGLLVVLLLIGKVLVMLLEIIVELLCVLFCIMLVLLGKFLMELLELFGNGMVFLLKDLLKFFWILGVLLDRLFGVLFCLKLGMVFFGNLLDLFCFLKDWNCWKRLVVFWFGFFKFLGFFNGYMNVNVIVNYVYLIVKVY